jgi:hypothetical protein
MKKIIYIVGLLSIVLLAGCSTKLQNEAVIHINGKDGLLNEDSQVTIKPIYKSISRFEGDDFTYQHPNYLNIHWIENESENSYAIVENIDGKFGIINKDGKLELKIIYDSIGRFYNGFAKIEVNNKFGLVNENFEVVVKPIYDEALEFVYNTIIVKKYGKYGCLNKDLELKIVPSLDMIYLQHEGFKRVEQNNKWGFLDTNCNFLVKPNFDYVNDFTNGFAKVKTNNQWGFLDTEGEFLVKPIFGDADKF